MDAAAGKKGAAWALPSTADNKPLALSTELLAAATDVPLAMGNFASGSELAFEAAANEELDEGPMRPPE